MSRYWPRPVRSRCNSAKPIDAAPLSPAVTSPIAAPGGQGGPSASPFMSITPAYDAPRVSNPGLFGQGAALAKAGNRTHDDARVDPAHRVVAQSQPPDRAGAEVLHYHIDSAGQVFEDLGSRGGLGVQAQAQLA